MRSRGARRYSLALGLALAGLLTSQWATAQARQGLILLNADTDQPIAGYDPLPSGAVLNLATLPTRNLSIRANINPATVGSVTFGYDGNASYQQASTAPYALAGTNGACDYRPWTPAGGRHTLTATPFAATGVTPFPLGAFVGRPNGSDATAQLDTRYDQFAALMGTAPIYMNAFINHAKSIANWPSDVDWTA